MPIRQLKAFAVLATGRGTSLLRRLNCMVSVYTLPRRRSLARRCEGQLEAEMRIHGVFERRKENVKPGERSIQIMPLVSKKGDGWVGLKAHGILHALKKSDTVLSLLFVTDVIAAWHNCQLISPMKK